MTGDVAVCSEVSGRDLGRALTDVQIHRTPCHGFYEVGRGHHAEFSRNRRLVRCSQIGFSISAVRNFLHRNDLRKWVRAVPQ
jgi:hypothetical protein